MRLEREAALAEARANSGARRRRGFVPPEREYCLLDPADEPDATSVPVRPAVTVSTFKWKNECCGLLFASKGSNKETTTKTFQGQL